MADQDSDSSESDLEGGVGNVNRLVMRPPGHTGKAKKGHLVFDAAFEGGNLGRVDYINDFEYDLFVRPDACNPRYRVWFNFTVENVRADQRVIFNIVNFSKTRALFRDGMTPIVKSTSRPKWQRLPTKYVFYYVSPEHNQRPVLSFLFSFDKDDDVYQFAYSYPYTYSRLQLYLEEMERRHQSCFRRETVAETVQMRPFYQVILSNSQPLPKKKRVVVVMARVHPGETPSSYVVQGLMDFLASDHPTAVTLRSHVIFHIFPMLNPDGVFLGNYRTSMLGFDLNRSWNENSEWAHPTLHATKSLLEDLDSDPETDLDMVIDIHAHSNLLGSFVYGNYYDDVYRFERHTLFPKLLAQATDDFSTLTSLYNRDPLKMGTARRYFASMLQDRVNCYTLEVSFHGYRINTVPDSSIIAYTEESCIL